MIPRKRLEKLLLASCARVQDEVGSLLGKPFQLGKPQFSQQLISSFFESISGKRVFARVQVDGELKGTGGLLTTVKSAIQIGGTLIMMPESEIGIVCKDEQYSDELQDAFGEVANIICGAVTVDFDEQYPQTVRLIRTEQEVINPAKIALAAVKPIPDEEYLIMVVKMQLNAKEIGDLELLLPAALFSLELTMPQAPAQTADKSAPASAESTPPTPEPCIDASMRSTPSSTAAAASGIGTPEERRRRKEKLDELLSRCAGRLSEEVGALLGGKVHFKFVQHLLASKAQFLDQMTEPQILARLSIRGDFQGEAYLFVELRLAIQLGGVLIMLPESEIEAAIRQQELSDDAKDAYGEVANIIAGVYSRTFEEDHNRKLGFVKTTLETVTPIKVAPTTDDVFPNQTYYHSIGTITFNSRELGQLQMLIPASVLELDEAEVDIPSDTATPHPRQTAPEASAVADRPRTVPRPSRPADILIVTDDVEESQQIQAALHELQSVAAILHFKDQLAGAITPAIRLIFLVMRDVSEQGFGTAIKIRSANPSIPLVAAGPAWTQTHVLKAVKYGACDILVTPASSAEIHEKVAMNTRR